MGETECVGYIVYRIVFAVCAFEICAHIVDIHGTWYTDGSTLNGGALWISLWCVIIEF